MSLPLTSPVVAVLRGHGTQKPGAKLPVTIHFLPADDGERCLACSFCLIYQKKDAHKGHNGRLKEDHLKSAEWVTFKDHLHNCLFCAEMMNILGDVRGARRRLLFTGRSSVRRRSSVQHNLRSSASLLMVLRSCCGRLEPDDE